MSCSQCCGIEQQFNNRVADRELRKYRRRGPRGTTARLLELIVESGIGVESLLDVGGGVGAIQHALAERGVSRITSVDASPAYLAAAKSESERRGYAEQAQYISANFVDAASDVAPADLVTLDRVVCCYNDLDALLGAAVSKARHAVGLVFPRDNLFIRAGLAAANWTLRLLGKDFQAFVHPHASIEGILRDEGFMPAATDRSALWRIALYTK